MGSGVEGRKADAWRGPCVLFRNVTCNCSLPMKREVSPVRYDLSMHTLDPPVPPHHVGFTPACNPMMDQCDPENVFTLLIRRPHTGRLLPVSCVPVSQCQRRDAPSCLHACLVRSWHVHGMFMSCGTVVLHKAVPEAMMLQQTCSYFSTCNPCSPPSRLYRSRRSRWFRSGCLTQVLFLDTSIKLTMWTAVLVVLMLRATSTNERISPAQQRVPRVSLSH